MALLTSPGILRLRNDPRLLKLPPYISLLCMLGGVIWVLLLPLNQYSRQTYISENALLPGQVHTYFGGSEQNVFRAYKQEMLSVIRPYNELVSAIDAQPFRGRNYAENELQLSEKIDERSNKIEELFQNAGLKTSRQKYAYKSSGDKYWGENVYSILNAPRGDSTEAIVLVAALKNIEGNDNVNGVALLITLARYFKRWSLWSKDIIFLVTHDSVAGPKAWIDAYHSMHSKYTAEDLSLLSGALQGAVCFDYPFDHRFETLHIAYDGINGQLPNLDLFNTAVSIASGQMGIGTSIQGMHKHDDSYYQRLLTLIKGMSSQAFGHATGPHSVFMRYHVDAITLTTIGQGWQDEMALGRTVESICRSLNNLLEHLHQSFFFYLLMQSNRFVSIGTYLPSAMAVAAGFTIMAIHLWVKSGHLEAKAEQTPVPDSHTAPDNAKDISTKKDATVGTEEEETEKEKPSTPDNAKDISTKKHATISTKEEEMEKEKPSAPPTNLQETTTATTTTDRQLAFPLTFLIAIHLLGLVPLYLFTLLSKKDLLQVLVLTSAITLLLPIILASALPNMPENVYLPALAAPTASQYTITKSLSLLVLGLLLSALATLNFSLSMTLGLLAVPLAFVGRVEPKDYKAKPWLAGLEYAALAVASPVGVVGGAAAWAFSQTGNVDAVVDAVNKAAFGWNVWSSWGVPVGIWCVWWPAWVVSAVLVASSWYAADNI